MGESLISLFIATKAQSSVMMKILIGSLSRSNFSGEITVWSSSSPASTPDGSNNYMELRTPTPVPTMCNKQKTDISDEEEENDDDISSEKSDGSSESSDPGHTPPPTKKKATKPKDMPTAPGEFIQTKRGGACRLSYGDQSVDAEPKET